MAGKISEMTLASSLNATDRVEGTQDPTGTPATKSFSLDQVEKWAQPNEIWLSAGQFFAVSGSVSHTTLASRWAVWLYDSDAAEVAAVPVQIPSRWATMHVDIVWANAGAGSGDVRWSIYLDRAAAGETTNAGAGGGTLTVTPTASTQYLVAVTRAGTGTAIDPTKYHNIRLSREGNHASDTLGNDAALLGVKLTRAS